MRRSGAKGHDDDEGFLVVDSSIIANAFAGAGGNIQLTAGNNHAPLRGLIRRYRRRWRVPSTRTATHVFWMAASMSMQNQTIALAYDPILAVGGPNVSPVPQAQVRQVG